MHERPIVHRAVWPELPATSDWLPYLETSLEQNWHTNFGPVSRQFEDALANRFGVVATSCVATSSATAGLAGCLISRNIKGDVICPAFTFPATISAVLMAACSPLIIDVDQHTMAVRATDLERALIQTGAKAAIVVAPYGFVTDFSEHATVCAEHGACLIIDNAAGLGVARAPYERDTHVDEVYSLHATKPFNIGEGGVIFSNKTNEDALRSALNFGLSTHGHSGTRSPPYWGINGKLTEVLAAIGMAVLNDIDERIAARQKMAQRWIDSFESFDQIAIHSNADAGPWQVFPVLMPDGHHADKFVQNARDRGVELRRYYRPSLGVCDGLRKLHECDVANNLASRCVTLPIRSKLADEQQADLINLSIEALELTLQN